MENGITLKSGIPGGVEGQRRTVDTPKRQRVESCEGKTRREKRGEERRGERARKRESGLWTGNRQLADAG